MDTLITILLDGLQYSSYLFIVSVGLTVIFGVMKDIECRPWQFLCLGRLYGSLFHWQISDMGWPDPFGFVIIFISAAAVGLILGLLIERGVLRYMYERDEVLIVLATFGIF